MSFDLPHNWNWNWNWNESLGSSQNGAEGKGQLNYGTVWMTIWWQMKELLGTPVEAHPLLSIKSSTFCLGENWCGKEQGNAIEDHDLINNFLLLCLDSTPYLFSILD